MYDFIEGFVKGAKETPRAFFAPAIALWRLVVWIFNYMMRLTDALTHS